MLNSLKTKSAYSSGNVPRDINVRTAFNDEPVGERAVNEWNTFSKESSQIGKLTANRLLAALPENDFARLLPHSQIISFAVGDVCQSIGAGDYLYFPQTAVFSQLNILEDGRAIETAMIGSDGMVGLSSILCLQPTEFWMQTLIAGSALRINTKIFKQEFARGGFLQAMMFDYINTYIAQISQRAVCNNHHLIEERFSSWLLMLADRTEKNNLSLTHDQIAQLLGVHRPSITCIAQDLREKKIINYVRGQIFILNRQKLEAHACECHSAVS